MKFDLKNIDKKVLLSLFKNMLKSRMIEEKMIILLRQGKFQNGLVELVKKQFLLVSLLL